MSSSIVLVKVTCLAIMMCMILGPKISFAIDCGQVSTRLTPCVAYVYTKGGPVPPPCCDGVKAINNEAKTNSDRKAACECVKTALATLRGVNEDTLADLPNKCGVKLPFKPGPKTDCNKIK